MLPRVRPPAGSLLWRSLRMYQVYGANTEVGKTIFTTLLCKAAKSRQPHEETVFLKPVSTGPDNEADENHLLQFAPDISTKTLFQYDLAVSPHIAAEASTSSIPTDDTLLARITSFANNQASRGTGWLFLETAGGVHSPGPSGTPQADLYTPLRLPVVLVGDSKLGGISQTISAFESLKIRGYDVATVLLFAEDTYQNYAYLTSYFSKHHNIPVFTVPAPPARDVDRATDISVMARYYNLNTTSPGVGSTLAHLISLHAARLARLDSMRTTAATKIWYPFTQQKHLAPADITVIDSAHGDYFHTLSPASPNPTPKANSLLLPTFDASASWWTQGLGHSSPHLALAAASAAGRYGHVMFASAIHEPALALAETLLAGMANPRLTRAFFSDNGSTGTEVAVKMALRAARERYKDWGKGERVGVLGLRGGYHGDTIGAMDCAEPGVFNEKVE
ncbi:mitochondrial bifunctional dethiobiotin synthetase/7,8-diamino-pelargonic acid aminotransferase, partial [Staphylotrichum tortipilum]